jgi:hypothetical protein
MRLTRAFSELSCGVTQIMGQSEVRFDEALCLEVGHLGRVCVAHASEQEIASEHYTYTNLTPVVARSQFFLATLVEITNESGRSGNVGRLQPSRTAASRTDSL